jgi:hypothetical protein|tara:strand:- start:268 stop:450 length:183 start_codon:yes stop_codon:yes gene_type:complete
MINGYNILKCIGIAFGYGSLISVVLLYKAIKILTANMKKYDYEMIDINEEINNSTLLENI